MLEHYGDRSRWFVATVINSTPPYGLEGRVKIRIRGVHSPSTGDIPEADLPWAQVLLPTTEAGVSGLGRTPKLTAGALVFGFFMDGAASQLPLVVGSLPKDEYPTAAQKYAFGDKVENLPVEALQSDTITSAATKRLRRRSEGMKFFIDNGYTINQAAGIVGNLDHASLLNPAGSGIGNWNQNRQSELIDFSLNFTKGGEAAALLSQRYLIQLRFVLYELRGSKGFANGKLLKSTKVEGDNGSAQIIKRYYIDNFDPVDENEVLEQCLVAKLETENA